jgi:hypothetical protein
MMKLWKQVAIAAAFAVAMVPANGQGRGGAPVSGKAGAAIDITGYWVALITEDWRYRMMVPAKGDFPNFPLTAEGRKIANSWDPAKDESSGNQCAAYGAGGITRMTGRLHLTWQDDNTMKADYDYGTQTRLFHFGAPPAQSGEPTWQGVTQASWEYAGPRGNPANKLGGTLKTVTTKMKPGYLQRNGVPYSANAIITERYDAVKEDDGTEYLIVTSMVEDPQYLARTILRSTHFRKEANGNGWDPQPCTVR